MKAFRECTNMQDHVKLGKQGLAAKHRDMLHESPKRRVAASLDFERAVSGALPSQRRWDYVIEASHIPGRSHAIEVHQYDESVLRQKRDGTKALLKKCCPDTPPSIDSWIVILEGASPRADVIARFRAQTGIQVVGRNLKISDIQVKK